MTPFVGFAFAAFAIGPNYKAGGGAPVDSPLKVWDGTAWRPAGVKVASP